jgi:hypothetical protein
VTYRRRTVRHTVTFTVTRHFPCDCWSPRFETATSDQILLQSGEPEQKLQQECRFWLGHQTQYCRSFQLEHQPIVSEFPLIPLLARAIVLSVLTRAKNQPMPPLPVLSMGAKQEVMGLPAGAVIDITERSIDHLTGNWIIHHISHHVDDDKDTNSCLLVLFLFTLSVQAVGPQSISANGFYSTPMVVVVLPSYWHHGHSLSVATDTS